MCSAVYTVQHNVHSAVQCKQYSELFKVLYGANSVNSAVQCEKCSARKVQYGANSTNSAVQCKIYNNTVCYFEPLYIAQTDLLIIAKV